MYSFFRIPTLRFCPGCSDLAVKIGSESKGANRKVGIALRFCLGCLLLAVKNGSGGKGANRKVGIAYNPTSRGHPLAKRAQGRTPKSAFKCGAPCQTRKSCNPNRKHQSTCDMTFACPCSRPLKSQQPRTSRAPPRIRLPIIRSRSLLYQGWRQTC